MYSIIKLSFFLSFIFSLIEVNVSAISFLDNDIKCRCGFKVDLNTDKKKLWIDNIIEDSGMIDYCDSKGEKDCVDFCRNQFSPNQNMIIRLHMIPKGYSISLGEIICGRLADNMVDFKQAKLMSTLVCKTKFFILTSNQAKDTFTGYLLDNKVTCKNGNMVKNDRDSSDENNNSFNDQSNKRLSSNKFNNRNPANNNRPFNNRPNPNYNYNNNDDNDYNNNNNYNNRPFDDSQNNNNNNNNLISRRPNERPLISSKYPTNNYQSSQSTPLYSQSTQNNQQNKPQSTGLFGNFNSPFNRTPNNNAQTVDQNDLNRNPNPSTNQYGYQTNYQQPQQTQQQISQQPNPSTNQFGYQTNYQQPQQQQTSQQPQQLISQQPQQQQQLISQQPQQQQLIQQQPQQQQPNTLINQNNQRYPNAQESNSNQPINSLNNQQTSLNRPNYPLINDNPSNNNLQSNQLISNNNEKPIIS